MIIVKEQYGYKNPKSIEYDLSAFTTIEPHKKLFKQKKSDGCCYEITKKIIASKSKLPILWE